MSEEKKKGFMAELAEWTAANVIAPLVGLSERGSIAEFENTAKAVQKAVQQKVLESYHNGQAAGPRQFTPRQQ